MFRMFRIERQERRPSPTNPCFQPTRALRKGAHMTARELRGRLTAVGIIVTLPAPLEIELDAVVSGSIPPEWLAEAKA